MSVDAQDITIPIEGKGAIITNQGNCGNPRYAIKQTPKPDVSDCAQ